MTKYFKAAAQGMITWRQKAVKATTIFISQAEQVMIH